MLADVVVFFNLGRWVYQCRPVCVVRLFVVDSRSILCGALAYSELLCFVSFFDECSICNHTSVLMYAWVAGHLD